MRTHGLSNTKIYKVYLSMLNRCYKNYDKFYPYYGGRGITVCKEWREDFLAFYDWSMANGYNDGLSIERKDVNGNYCPENCTWITMPEQQRNKRNNVHIFYNGEDMLLVDVAKELGVVPSAISQRIKNGKSPISPKFIRDKKVIRDDGVVYGSVREAGKMNNVHESRISMVCNGKRARTAGHSFEFLISAEQALSEMEGKK